MGLWELYDLDEDRSELNDLSEKHSDRAKDMAEQWEAWADRSFGKALAMEQKK